MTLRLCNIERSASCLPGFVISRPLPLQLGLDSYPFLDLVDGLEFVEFPEHVLPEVCGQDPQQLTPTILKVHYFAAGLAVLLIQRLPVSQCLFHKAVAADLRLHLDLVSQPVSSTGRLGVDVKHQLTPDIQPILAVIVFECLLGLPRHAVLEEAPHML